MRTSRHGTRYAAGSQTTFDGYEPSLRVCPGCGERTLMGGNLDLHFQALIDPRGHATKAVFHFDCWIGLRKQAA